MRSRYDLMTTSTEVDPIGLEPYPDPLSVEYDAFEATEAPYQYEIDDKLITKPYMITNGLYGFTDLEDVIFDMNTIGHVQQLIPKVAAEVVLFPVEADLLSFYSNNQVLQ